MKKIILGVIPVATSLAFPLLAQAATIHIKHVSQGSWSMACDVVTSGNKITKVRNLSIKASSGYVSNKKVIINKETARIQFTRHLNLLTYYSSATIKVKSGKLYVTAN